MHTQQAVHRMMHKANRLAYEAQQTEKLAHACLHAGNVQGFTDATRYAKSLRDAAGRLIELLPICVC